tara:strand:+ start:2053 stop:2655 length:603 start_codon:yes stop_codon:yes gene_type:complete
MPTIKLKPSSAEFESEFTRDDTTRYCEMPGCPSHGDYRAPKHRGLNEYHYFCLDHVSEYNKAWNYFEGMNEKEVQEQIYKDWYGDRPTWNYRDFASLEEELFRKTASFRAEGAEQGKKQDDRAKRQYAHTPEMEAMNELGLEPPVTLDEIKKTYKTLVKKYHPDHNKEDPEAEEKLKKVNMAYTILKVAYTEFEKLPDQK